MNPHAVALKIATGLTLATMLSGCSLVHLPIFGHRAVFKPTSLATMQSSADDTDTQEGRRKLADGQPGGAIESLQRALSRGESVAPALNALGVAYARIGRLDLAERYIAEATSLEPSDTHYAANLVLVLQTRDARAEEARRAREKSSVAAALAKAAVPTPSPGRLERVSRLEIRIVTVPTQAAPLYRAVSVDRPRVDAPKASRATANLDTGIVTAPANAAPRTGSASSSSALALANIIARPAGRGETVEQVR